MIPKESSMTSSTCKNTTQDVCCPQCKTTSILEFTTKDYNRKTSNQDFCYYKCPECTLLFLSPIPQNLEEYYPSDYHHFPSSEEEMLNWSAVEKYKLNIVKEFAQHGKMLDIGPSWGGFALLAKRDGFDVETIEMDARCCDFLNNTLKIPTIHSNDIAASLKKLSPYDIVTLWHVIEHFIDPWEVLKAVDSSVKPNGLLVIAAPNPESWQHGILKQRWVHIDAPRHLELIPANLIIEFLKPMGYQPILCTSTDPGCLMWNRFGWEFSLSNLSSSKRAKRLLSFLGRVICRLSRPLERRGLSGSGYTLVFRKR